MNHAIQTEENLPWYRHLWPWLVMIPPLGAVIGGFITLYLAGAIPVMVVDDYGRIDEISERRQDQDRRAAELGLVARLEIGGDEGAGSVAVSLDARDGEELPGLVVIRLFHPTLRGRDHTAFLPGSAGRYRGELERPAGRYYVEIGDAAETWRLTGEIAEGATNGVIRAADPEVSAP